MIFDKLFSHYSFEIVNTIIKCISIQLIYLSVQEEQRSKIYLFVKWTMKSILLLFISYDKYICSDIIYTEVILSTIVHLQITYFDF